MSKVVYIIPGFKGSTDLDRFQRVIKYFELRHFKVVPITITWRNKVMSDYVDEFFSQLVHKKDDEVYLFGFSFGAMIAFIAATRIKTKVLILCSLSAYFKEDLKFVKKSWKSYVGKNRMRDCCNFSFQNLIKRINCKTILIVGNKEDEILLKKSRDVHKKIKNSELFIVNARHDISQEKYMNKICAVIKDL